MAIQLTPEQERKVQAVVSAGAYGSVEEALDAAVAALENAGDCDFEGSQEELEALIQEGLNSGEPIEADEAFWDRFVAETDRIAAEHMARSSAGENSDFGSGRGVFARFAAT